MADRLKGKVAVVTGAGQGIGKGCALEFAAEGADVIVNDRPGNPQAEETAAQIRELGRSACVVGADAFSRSGCETIVAAALAEFGRIDILLSNPAVNNRRPFLELEPEEFNRVLQGTLVGGFHIGQLVARHMVERGGGGKIVFISSVHAEMPIAESVAYGAAKSGLNLMARTMAIELAPHGIHVNAIAPGWIDTPNERQHFGDAFIEEQAPHLPLRRLGRPEEIGKVATLLVSSDGDYITGSIVKVDGGFTIKHCGRVQ